MKRYKEIKARDLKEGSIVIKSHGYAERVESIVDVTENVKLISFSDSYDNIHEVYVRNDQKYNVRTEDLQEGKLFDRLVSQLKAKGMPEDKAYATATSQLQKHGSMKSGTRELTKHGKKEKKWVQPVERRTVLQRNQEESLLIISTILKPTELPWLEKRLNRVRRLK